MGYLVDLPPNECLESGTRYMIGKGYSVDYQTETTVVLSPSPEISARVGCLILLSVLFTAGTSLAVLVLVFYKWKATILAAPATGGQTRLTVSSPVDQTRQTLRGWVGEEMEDRARPAQV